MYKKHYVPSTPQLATDLGLNYRTNSYWFFELHAQYFANSYLDMNPLYRTLMAVAGPDKVVTPVEVEYMAAQEKFDPAFLLNLSVGKSWYIDRKYNFGFSLNVQNLLAKIGRISMELLAGSHRHCILELCTAHLQDVSKLLSLLVERLDKELEVLHILLVCSVETEVNTAGVCVVG